jgi:hypothetical protein
MLPQGSDFPRPIFCGLINSNWARIVATMEKNIARLIPYVSRISYIRERQNNYSIKFLAAKSQFTRFQNDSTYFGRALR